MLDVVISFDTTGSMYPCLSEVRRKVADLIATLFRETSDLRVGIIAHGDYCDAGLMVQQLYLTDNQQRIIDFVRDVPPTYGGDNDECYELVIHNVTKFNWRAEAEKVFVLIGDASPHEVGYTFGSIKVIHDWRFYAQALANQDIRLYAVQCLNRAENSAFYDTLAKIHKTPKLALHQFSNIVPLLSAVVYKQQSDDRVVQYANELQNDGILNRNIVDIFNSILGEERIGGFSYPEERSKEELSLIDPARFQVLHVDSEVDIMSFVSSTGATFKKGRGFYELTKVEVVQETKEVVLQDKRTGDMYSGAKARQMIGIPYGVRGKVYHKRDFPYRVFIQSTSSNRKLMPNTMFLYEAK